MEQVSPKLLSRDKLKTFRKSYEEMTIWTVRLEELGLLRHREEGLWSTSEILIFHILLLRLSSPLAKEADIIRIHSRMMGEAIHPEKVSKIIEKFREAGILLPQPSKSLALTSRAYDIWFSRHIRYCAKIFERQEIVKEEKLRTLIGRSLESLLVSPSRSTVDSKLRRLTRKLSATFCRL